MRPTIVAHEYNDNLNQEVSVIRHIGQVRNISLETWGSKERDKIALVIVPTVTGFTILAEGPFDNADTFANVGTTVLRALAATMPLVTGEHFRVEAGGSDVMPPVVRQ